MKSPSYETPAHSVACFCHARAVAELAVHQTHAVTKHDVLPLIFLHLWAQSQKDAAQLRDDEKKNPYCGKFTWRAIAVKCAVYLRFTSSTIAHEQSWTLTFSWGCEVFLPIAVITVSLKKDSLDKCVISFGMKERQSYLQWDMEREKNPWPCAPYPTE